MPNAEKVNCVELTIVEGRCVYLNDTRIAGGKPYVSENLQHTHYDVPVDDVLSALGQTIEQSSKVDDFADSVIAAADLQKRLSDAVTLLYTHGVITKKMRDHARRNL